MLIKGIGESLGAASDSPRALGRSRQLVAKINGRIIRNLMVFGFEKGIKSGGKLEDPFVNLKKCYGLKVS